MRDAADGSIHAALSAAERELSRHGIDDARLDVEVLLAHVLACDRARLLTRSRDPLPAETRAAFDELVRRRAARIPVAYLVGTKEFYGLTFRVGPAVLVPRPETEAVVDAARAFVTSRGRRERPAWVLDVGTGSGAIAVAIAASSPTTRVIAIDKSAAALEVAAENVRRQDLVERVSLIRCDLGALARVFAPRSFDLLVSNPPYVTEPSEGFSAELAHEPRIALAGDSGAFPAVYRSLLEVAGALLVPDGAFIAEVGCGQAEVVAALARDSGAFRTVATTDDLAGIPRVVVASRN